MLITDIKCVVLGDGAVGKTSLIYSYARNQFLTERIPNSYDYDTEVTTVDGETVGLHIWDTAGGEEYDRLRPLLYPETNVFLICFSLVQISSFENVRDKWVPEVQLHAGDVPYLVIGTKSDLQSDILSNPDVQFEGVRLEDAKTMAEELNAVRYMECSASTKDGIQEIFEEAVTIAIEGNKSRNSSATRRRKLKKGKCNIT